MSDTVQVHMLFIPLLRASPTNRSSIEKPKLVAPAADGDSYDATTPSCVVLKERRGR